VQPPAAAGVSCQVSNVVRLAITFVMALFIGAHTCANAFDLDRSGDLGTIVFSPAFDWAVFVLPILAVALVNRWWALCLAAVPFAVLFYLHSATDYVYPFHEDPYPTIAIVSIVFLTAAYSLGFLLRAVVDRIVAGARPLGS
jgi:hypothetical protein